jgi:SAM-dependent methyltransferase
MAKLTKAQAKLHRQAVELLQLPELTIEQKEFVLDHWHEGANTVQGDAGAFFTPRGLANDFAIDVCGRRVIDLCAGIGVLSFALHHYKHKPQSCGRDYLRECEYVCVEINPAYVEIGRKLLPEATWICGDAFDVETLAGLGRFDVAISNPPFGKVPSARAFSGRYSGPEADLKLVEVASRVADCGVFLLPQMSAPFLYSGSKPFREVKDGKAARFMAQTGAHMEPGCGVDCAFYAGDWKQPVPLCEVVLCDFQGCQGATVAPGRPPAAAAALPPVRPRDSSVAQLSLL